MPRPWNGVGARPKEKVKVPKPRGRPKGSKNITTVALENLEERQIRVVGGLMWKEITEVVGTVINKAKDGDMQAAKLILDRLIPAKRALEESQKAGMNIQINIVGDNYGENPDEGETISGESRPAIGQSNAEALGTQELAEHASAAGEWTVTETAVS